MCVCMGTYVCVCVWVLLITIRKTRKGYTVPVTVYKVYNKVIRGVVKRSYLCYHKV